jgi:subtilisin family serine protease
MFDAAGRNELNVLGRRICNSADCNTSNMADPDNIGHGTMIAGIAAAKSANNTGLVGVAPNAGLISVKIFDIGIPATTFDVALSALDYVASAGTSGDVVNISWGMEYDPNPLSIQSRIEAKLKVLADAGMRISIAAGNVHVLGGPGYVTLISPARIGGYRNANGGGIFTVSGVRSIEKNADWKDRFWADSAYGNPQKDSAGTVVRQGPPDFAEPAFEIESLWPIANGRVNTCYGTSFAAAHMAGILVRGQPGTWPGGSEKRAEKDPSAIRPNLSGYVDALKDPIGVTPDFKPTF